MQRWFAYIVATYMKMLIYHLLGCLCMKGFKCIRKKPIHEKHTDQQLVLSCFYLVVYASYAGRAGFVAGR